MSLRHTYLLTCFKFNKYLVIVTSLGGVSKRKLIHAKVIFLCTQILNVKCNLIYPKTNTFNFKLIVF